MGSREPPPTAAVIPIHARPLTLAVSCKGGLGRMGTLAACLLKRAGLDPDTAMSVVRRSRPAAIDHGDQEALIRAW